MNAASSRHLALLGKTGQQTADPTAGEKLVEYIRRRRCIYALSPKILSNDGSRGPTKVQKINPSCAARFIVNWILPAGSSRQDSTALRVRAQAQPASGPETPSPRPGS
jgi:hypothetical protein